LNFKAYGNCSVPVVRYSTSRFRIIDYWITGVLEQTIHRLILITIMHLNFNTSENLLAEQ